MRPPQSRLMWVAFAVVIGFVAALVVRQHRPAVEDVEAYGIVPDFTLVDRTGRTVTRRDFLDEISVVDFFYTRCRDACPLQSAQMARLQADYAGRRGLQLVSITVDPGHDDSETLARYADRYGADPSRWLFLTGPRDVIYRLAVDGFHLAAVAAAHEPVPPTAWSLSRPSAAFAHEAGHDSRIIQLAHGSHFAVVDREARIVGYFDSLDASQMQNLSATLDHLLNAVTIGQHHVRG
jgi:cytochrome oxidase Cu insertion factor (SCO1/SenC/PrrC family)